MVTTIAHSRDHLLSIGILELATGTFLQTTTWACQDQERLPKMTVLTFSFTEFLVPYTNVRTSGPISCASCLAGIGERATRALHPLTHSLRDEAIELLMHVFRRITPTGVVQLGLDVWDECA